MRLNTTLRSAFVLAILLISTLASQGGAASAAEAATRVVQAAKAEDWTTVGDLIRQHADVNARDGEGATALTWAAHWDNLAVVRSLLAAKAAVQPVNRLGISPLLEASRLGDAAIVDALLSAGADPNIDDPDGETPLMAASGAGSVDALRLLLKAGAHVNAEDDWQGETALMWAAAEGHLDVVEMLIKADADLNIVGKPSTLIHHKGGFAGGRGFQDHASRGLTAIMMAARQGNFEVTKALAEAGADLKHANPDGATALMIAILNSHFDLAAMLLEEGADANDGSSLYEAVDMHNLAPVVTTGDATRPRPYHQNKLTALDLVARLLDHGADSNKMFTGVMHFGQPAQAPITNASPLIRAANASDVAVIRLMVAHGANVNQPDQLMPVTVDPFGPPVLGGPTAGFTPLMIAMAPGGGGRGFGGFGGRGGPPQFREPSERNPLAAAKAMLESPLLDVNATTPAGDTALHRAAQAGNVPMIQALADRGAKLDLKNAAGFTPLDLALGKGAPARAPAGRGPGGGGFGRGGPAAPAGPQPEAIALLQKLMGLPPQ